MTGTVTSLRWAGTWSYDARLYVMHPRLAPVFIAPPLTRWQEWLDELERPDENDKAGDETS